MNRDIGPQHKAGTLTKNISKSWKENLAKINSLLKFNASREYYRMIEIYKQVHKVIHTYSIFYFNYFYLGIPQELVIIIILFGSSHLI